MAELRVTPGDFACVRAFGGIGKAIEIGEWLNGDGFAPYEHVYGYAGYYPQTPIVAREGKVPVCGEGRGHYVIEAMPHGARLRRLDGRPSQQAGALWSTGRIPLTRDQRSVVVQNAFALLGTPYSFLDYFALASRRLHLWPVDSLLRGRVADSGHLICSQYWTLCYYRAGVPLFGDTFTGYVTPLDMAHYLEKHGQ